MANAQLVSDGENRVKLLSHIGRVSQNTPQHRDRVVDAVRGLSLVIVVFGHLFLAVVYWPDGDPPRLGSLMLAYPWTQLLTWVLQVMPLFFAFGGAANARGWLRARETDTAYSTWMWGRIQRLLRPVIIYLLICAIAAWMTSLIWGDLVAPLLGQLGVQLWFLGVYIVTTALLPAMLAWHRRSPASPFVALVPVVVVINIGTTIGGWPLPVGVINVIVVWLLLQQLGFFWRSNPADANAQRWALIGLGSLGLGIFLVAWGPWPMSLIGIPGDRLVFDSLSVFGSTITVPGYEGDYSNMFPPSIVLLLQGVSIVSAIFVFQRPLNQFLHRTRVWWAVTGINMTAMSTYLWHVPAIMFAFVILHALGLDPPTEIGDAGYPVPISAGPYFVWFAGLLAVFVALLIVFVSVLWSTEYRTLPWWDGRVRFSLYEVGSVRRTIVLASGVVILWAAFIILAIVGLRGFPTETRYWSSIPVNALWGIAGVFIGSAIVRLTSRQADFP